MSEEGLALGDWTSVVNRGVAVGWPVGEVGPVAVGRYVVGMGKRKRMERRCFISRIVISDRY